jgi:hypothetical protein
MTQRVVGKSRADAARSYLKRHSGIDFEAFLREVESDDLLAEPLGPTEDCVSADELAAYCEDRATEIDPERLERIETHLVACEDCRASVKLYSSLTLRTSTSAPLVHILELEPVDVAPGKQNVLNVVLLANRKLARIQTLTLQCSAIDVRLQHLKRVWRPFQAQRVYSARFAIDRARFLERGSSEVCDKITVKGRTKAGERFSTSSQVCFKQTSRRRVTVENSHSPRKFVLKAARSVKRIASCADHTLLDSANRSVPLSEASLISDDVGFF